MDTETRQRLLEQHIKHGQQTIQSNSPTVRTIETPCQRYSIDVHQQQKMKDVFTDIFSIPLPTTMQQRACHEQNIVHGIRKQLKQHELILRRTANQRNVFYLGNRKDFEREANEYLTETDHLNNKELHADLLKN